VVAFELLLLCIAACRQQAMLTILQSSPLINGSFETREQGETESVLTHKNMSENMSDLNYKREGSLRTV
jgi:hypothetical protein